MKKLKSYPAIYDLKQSIEQLQMIAYIALSDLKARYKRSVLGPLWLTINTLVGASGLGFLWSELMNVDRASFIPSLTSGLILWSFISGVIIDSSTVYSRNANIIRNIGLPLSVYPAQLIFKHLINLLHTLPVFFVVTLLLGNSFSAVTWFAALGIILVALNMLWISLLIGMIGARFRDLEHMITSIMTLLMMLSPVFYRPKYLPFSETLLWFNPFSHFIEIVRYPLLGLTPPMFIIETNFIMLLVGTTTTVWLFNRKHHRISFWI
ncbi:MAG: ABC transporter permease [Limnohabitans sp.]